jgi:CxxC motif-containing protein (DUF1111 family)
MISEKFKSCQALLRPMITLGVTLALVWACTSLPEGLQRERSGGEMTTFSTTSNAFSIPATQLSPEELKMHLRGDIQFEAVYVKSPAPINAGLGPIFNTSSCISCHLKDGRAPFPEPISKRSGLLVRTSLPGEDEHGGPLPVPGFGLQIQNHAVYGFVPEAQYEVIFEYSEEIFPDGSRVELRKPIIRLIQPYRPLPEDILLSPRIGTPMFGLGLLELIPEQNLVSMADPEDKDGDGISGKINRVFDPITKRMQVGRFGWKANVPNIEAQTAIAFIEDMGITSPVFPEEHAYEQHHDFNTSSPEIEQSVLDEIVFYTRTLAVPAPRHLKDKEVRKGEAIFSQIGCQKCHVPQQISGYSPIKVLSHQTFYPYTDLLLHDMGEGLADHRPDYLANGREWKTRPLWGIGLTQRVNGHTHFLHDGRARNLEEAILWHGGEAQDAQQKYKQLNQKDRARLLRFLESL